jgi:poly-gamma-glutamate synthesis protein (capsule biosynthesis protein)
MPGDPGSVALVAVGDVSLGDHPMCVGRGIGSQLRRFGAGRPSYPFEYVERLFEGADLVFGNLETALGNHGLRPSDIQSLEMRGPEDGATRLRAAGFNVVNIANNHILQHGREAFDATVAALAQQGVAVVGVRQHGRPAAEPVLVERDGVRIAFLGYAFEPDRYFSGTPLYAFGPSCDIPAEVRAARAQADVVVCSMHWGDEFIRYPNSEMRRLGRAAIDAGAHAVLGHHPHVFQGVETYRDGVIAYSLGNFAFDMSWDPALRTGLTLRLTLTARGVSGMEPAFVTMADDYQPVPVEASSSRSFKEEVDMLSARVLDSPTDAEYAREYAALVSRNRLQSYAHVLRHATQYAPGTLATILARPIMRRLRKQ